MMILHANTNIDLKLNNLIYWFLYDHYNNFMLEIQIFLREKNFKKMLELYPNELKGMVLIEGVPRDSFYGIEHRKIYEYNDSKRKTILINKEDINYFKLIENNYHEIVDLDEELYEKIKQCI